VGSRTGIAWTDCTCAKCSVPLTPDNRVEMQRRLCKDCKNAAARGRYLKRGRLRRRGWLTPARDNDKRQARRRVNYLVEQGLIPRPDDLPCLDCGDEVFGVRYRHEYDHARGYAAKDQLYVEPVCSRCHHNREEARRAPAA